MLTKRSIVGHAMCWCVCSSILAQAVQESQTVPRPLGGSSVTKELRLGLLITIGPNGRCEFSRRPSAMPRSVPRSLEQLKSQLVKNAIDVVPEQDRSIRELLKKARHDTDVLFQGDRGPSMEQVRHKLQREVERILLPHQLKKLKRFRDRYDLLVKGAPGLLNELDATSGHTRFDQACAELRKHIHDRVRDATAGLCDKIREVLDSEQNDKMKQYYVLEPVLQKLPIEIWIWQLNGKRQATAADDDGVLKTLRTGLFFQLGPSGALQSADNLNSALTVDILLREIVKSDYSQADVLSCQIQDYLQSAGNDKATVKKLETRQAEIQQAMLSGEIGLDEAATRMKRLIADLEHWKWERFQNVLLPDQRQTLELLIERRAIVQQGWLRSLTDGPLVDMLRLSKEQSQQLERLRKTMYKHFVKLSRDLDDECVRTLRRLAPPDCKKRLVSIKDLECNELPGAPELLVTQRR